jgi:hypothetical protein
MAARKFMLWQACQRQYLYFCTSICTFALESKNGGEEVHALAGVSASVSVLVY